MRTCGQLLLNRASNSPEEIFYVSAEKKVTYREVNDNSNRIANALLDLGINKGDKIGLLLRNNLEHIYVWYGVTKIGAVCVPINIQLQTEHLAHIINNSDAETIFIEKDLIAQIEACRQMIPRLKRVVVVGGECATSSWEIKLFDSLLNSAKEFPNITVNNTDLAALLYTSGTTGLPKGVMLSHEYYIAGGELLAESMKETGKDTFYATLPFYHIMGQIQGIQTPLQVGGKAVISDKFSVSRFWDEVRQYGLTVVCLTGTQCNYLFQQDPKPDDGNSGLRLVMAFPVPVEIAPEFEKRFKVKLRSIYGLTECLLPLVASVDGEYKLGSLGKPTDYEIRIADDADNEMPVNEPGNILARPKNISRRVFDGYYKMPEATIEMLKHCWFHTGDMGYRDADGFIWFASRKKDVIRFRGENISATHVESIISSNPMVAECAVIGVPSSVGEEDVKVCIRLKENQTMTCQELMAFCEERMTWFMVPRYVEFVETPLPRNATDKVEKNKLKADWKTNRTWDRETAGYKVKKS